MSFQLLIGVNVGVLQVEESLIALLLMWRDLHGSFMATFSATMAIAFSGVAIRTNPENKTGSLFLL